MFFVFLIVVVVCAFVFAVSKMGIDYSLKVEKIKHGYPLDESGVKREDIVDYRGDRTQ